MTPPVAILVPVLRRPQNVRPLVESIAAATPLPWRVYFVLDPGDAAEMDAVCEVAHSYGSQIVAMECASNYAGKINHAAAFTTEELVFLGADDLHFHSGWLEACCRRLDPVLGVVGTSDRCNRRTLGGVPHRTHSTHSLVARWYIDEFGTIDEPGKVLHEGYPHEFVDDEFVETAKHRGMYAHAQDAVVEHMHPMIGKAPSDELYEAQPARMKAGRRVYEARRHLWT